MAMPQRICRLAVRSHSQRTWSRCICTLRSRGHRQLVNPHQTHPSGPPQQHLLVQHRRTFSTGTARHAPSKLSVKRQSSPSIAVSMKAQQGKLEQSGEVLDYVGLLPGTFVMPTGSNLPKSVSARVKLQYRRVKVWAVDWFFTRMQAFVYFRPRPKLAPRETPQIAKELYESAFAAFATGKLGTVADRLCPGFRTSLERRMAQRDSNTLLVWKLHRHISSPRLMSFRLQVTDTKSAKEAQNGIIQAVVRLHTRQSLVHLQKRRESQTGNVILATVDSQGDVIPQEEVDEYERKNAKDNIEYVVLQKHIKQSKPEDWRIWGTAQETTLERLEKEDKAATELLLAHRSSL